MVGDLIGVPVDAVVLRSGEVVRLRVVPRELDERSG
jgi:hypothetical protein